MNSIDVTSLFLQALSLEILFKDFNNWEFENNRNKKEILN